MKKANKKGKYWYKIDVKECPICGKQHIYRKRMYTKKPKDYNQRYTWSIDPSCYCIYDWGVFS